MEAEESEKSQHKGGYRQINKALNICAFDDYLETQLSTLPEIADVEQISPRVLRVLGQNAGKFTLQGTNTYVVGTGSQRLLIDTGQGIPEWSTLIHSVLAEGKITISHVLLSHWHGDHVGGLPDLLRLYPHLSGSIYKHSPSKTQQEIVDGQIFHVEGATVRALHTPGHSHDHMCFVLEEDNAIFTGDNVLGHGTAAVEMLSVWMKSLRLMQAQGSKLGYPAHGMVITDLPGKITGELASKMRREKQVLSALGKIKRRAASGRGDATVREIVTVMYGEGIAGEVRQMAIEPFMDEVLRKLSEDGKVAFTVRGGAKKWFQIQSQ